MGSVVEPDACHPAFPKQLSHSHQTFFLLVLFLSKWKDILKETHTDTYKLKISINLDLCNHQKWNNKTCSPFSSVLVSITTWVRYLVLLCIHQLVVNFICFTVGQPTSCEYNLPVIGHARPTSNLYHIIQCWKSVKVFKQSWRLG